MEYVNKATDALKTFREERLPGMKPAPTAEFFDHRQLSRPTTMNEATQRITYNARYFSGNYLLVIIGLCIYALITNLYLLLAILVFAGGFTAINRLGPEPREVAGQMITQKMMYTALFVVGGLLLIISGPVSVLFWLVGSSAILILAHAVFMETGLESEYQSVESA